MWCKIYNSSEYGQIVVTRTRDEDDKDCINITVNINETYCVFGLGFDSAEKAKAAFDLVGYKQAKIAVRSMV